MPERSPGVECVLRLASLCVLRRPRYKPRPVAIDAHTRRAKVA
jgi:hypothetical protein